MSCVVAFPSQDECKIYSSMSDVPEGVVAFSSPEELAKVATTETLDGVRKKLLGENIGKSSSRQEAAERLWYVLTLGAPKEIEWSNKWERRRDGFGNFKEADHSKIELIQLLYEPGKDYMVDHFYKKMFPQAKKIIQMLIDDGRGIWTNEEANQVIAARADEIKTKQGAVAVFQYYKSEYFQFHILKRVSFAEFAAKSEFSELTCTKNLSETLGS